MFQIAWWQSANSSWNTSADFDKKTIFSFCNYQWTTPQLLLAMTFVTTNWANEPSATNANSSANVIDSWRWWSCRPVGQFFLNVYNILNNEVQTTNNECLKNIISYFCVRTNFNALLNKTPAIGTQTGRTAQLTQKITPHSANWYIRDFKNFHKLFRWVELFVVTFDVTWCFCGYCTMKSATAGILAECHVESRIILQFFTGQHARSRINWVIKVQKRRVSEIIATYKAVSKFDI